MKATDFIKTVLLTGFAITFLSGGFMPQEAAAFTDSRGSEIATGGGKVKILSPEDKAVVKGASVTVSFEIMDKGKKGDHVHLFMDGKLVKPLRGVKGEYTIKSVASGKHKIEIRLATKGHTVLAISDSVTINVK